MLNSSEELGNRILNFTFNQTGNLLFIATSKGFRILRIEDSKLTSQRDKESDTHFPVTFTQGGFSILAPMFSTQLLCCVGSPSNTRYPPNIVFFWDEYHCDMKGEIRFRTEVKNVLIRRDKVVIVLEKIVSVTQTYVYLLSTLKPIASIPTIHNERGVCAISYDKDRFVLATLDTQPGHVRVENFYINEVKRGFLHENPISLLALDFTGQHGASASEQGTIIRVFDTMSLDILHEFRRGTNPAVISSLSFSRDMKYLVGCSNRPTVHVWNLEEQPQGMLGGFMKSYLPTYFTYDRNFAQIEINPEVRWTCPGTIAAGSIACFTDENKIAIASLDGVLYQCELDIERQTLQVVTQVSFLDFEGQSVVEGDRSWQSFD